MEATAPKLCHPYRAEIDFEVMTLPLEIKSEEELENVLTQPAPALVQFITQVQSPLVILGAGGKMGPTLAVLAKRAAEQARHPLDVIAVSRFSDPQCKAWLESRGVITHEADLLKRQDVDRLPGSTNIIYLVGLKFGTTQNPAATWAMNAIPPALVSQRYPASKIVALSSGNVYPLSNVNTLGSQEEDPLTPLGEYPNAVVARERIFEFYSRQNNTPIALIRLFYAVELRYGVLVDIATKILRGEPISLMNGYFNCIWQADANEMIIRSLGLAASPPARFNLCQPQVYSVRSVAVDLGEHMQSPPLFADTEAPTALIGDPSRICQALGRPGTRFVQVLKWTADWVRKGGKTLNKPTHFEVRDGVY
jgi:nucleoside-diphosphate-sugar epimerase